ncbi:MAG: DNA primase [Pseudomonadota bacterium]
MIPQEFIDQLVDRLDIVEIIGRYVPLKKAGQNFSACCPFHNEKTPSFSVSPSKQFYHCFGCGAHGNAIRFVMDHTGTPFIETITQLAQQVGMEVPRETSRQSPEERQTQRNAHQAAYDLLQSVTHLYSDQLTHTPHAQQYLKQRGVNQESIDSFKIGYGAGRGNNSVLHHFASQRALLLEHGLIAISERDQQPYDRLRDRLIFPIQDGQGRYVGFGGRSLHDENTPKYLNSPETPLFNKSRLLYGLHLARPHFRTADCAIIVEGYLDVIMLHQYGIKHAVATLGTALNPEHLKMLFRQTSTIVFCFDGDAAGQKAAQRALDHSLTIIEDGQTIRFLFLPEQHDPDSFVRQFGTDAFNKHIEAAPPLSEVWIDRWLKQHPPTHAEARAALWKGAKQDLETIIHAPLLTKFLREALYDKINTAQRKANAPTSSNKNTYSSNYKKGSKYSKRSDYEEIMPPPQQERSFWHSALEVALCAPHLIPKLPPIPSGSNQPEAKALKALLSLPYQESGGFDFSHPSLKSYQTIFNDTIERTQKKGQSHTDFDAEAELEALCRKAHSVANPLLTSHRSPSTMTEAEKEALRLHFAQKKNSNK